MINRRQLLAAAGVTALGGVPSVEAGKQNGLVGRVFSEGDVPVSGARVTLYSPDFLLFRETRSSKKGRYAFPRVSTGNHLLAVSAPGFLHRIVIVSVTGGVRNEDFGLVPETEGGEWSNIGQLDPALTGGPLSGTLLPDGRVFFSSDAVNSQLFDPLTGSVTATIPASTQQSGHASSLLPDGRVLLVGGGTLEAGGGVTPVSTVRAYAPNEGVWEEWSGLLEARWQPSLTLLPDGRFLVSGGTGVGGTLLPSCEILDPATGVSAAAEGLSEGPGLAPGLSLSTGKVLQTWPAPRLYDPVAGTWAAAAPLTQPNRANLEDCPDDGNPPSGEPPRPGELPDHLLVPFPHGVAAIGTRRTATPGEPVMVEYYDSRRNAWMAGGSPRTLRSIPLALPLPDGRILVAGGRQEDAETAQDVDEWCHVPRADLLDTDRGTWRRVEDLPVARSARGISLLLPDGRALITGGAGAPSPSAPAGGADAIHLYRPPYLERGKRPEILTISTSNLLRGTSFTMTLRFGQLLTDVVLLGMRACSGYSDGGPQRFVRLRFTVRKGNVRVTVPKKSDPLPPGHYLLFALVDDVPSLGQVVTLA